MLTDMTECDISREMNNDLSSDPNLNYDILTKIKSKYLHFKFNKFHRQKHKHSNWISFEIIRS